MGTYLYLWQSFPFVLLLYVSHCAKCKRCTVSFNFWINTSRIPTLKIRKLRLLEFNNLAKRKKIVRRIAGTKFWYSVSKA